jgi:polar amino acid transport system substrate-binding protein
LKKVIGLSILAIILLAIVLAISGCASPTPSAAPTVAPTATPNPLNHTSTINGVTYTFTTHKPGVLTIPSDATYPPFESINTTTNAFEGFDIELMNQICKELNVTPEYSNMVFDSIITDIQTNKDDLSISAFTIKPDRQKAIDFSDAYYENAGQYIMTKINSPIKNATDLVGKTVGAEKGTVGYYDVLNITGYSANDLHGYDTMPDSFMALQKGDVEAVVGDYAVMQPFVQQHATDFVFSPEPISATEYFGIVISKDNPQLTAAINAALKNIKADGRYQTIYDKWFSV